MLAIDKLKFDEKGLIPAVVVDAISKKVLTEGCSRNPCGASSITDCINGVMIG